MGKNSIQSTPKNILASIYIGKLSSSWHTVMFQGERWSMTLGTAVYSFKTKVKVQIRKCAFDAPTATCWEAIKCLQISHYSSGLSILLHVTVQRPTVTVVFSTRPSHMSRCCCHLQQRVECICRWHWNMLHIHMKHNSRITI